MALAESDGKEKLTLLEPLGFLDGLMARFHGPMSFRLFLQPLVALFFAFRDGRKDAREGKTAFFWGLFSDPENRREMLRSGWKSIGKVFVIAVVLDFVFQFVVFRGIRPGGALVTGIVLAIIPYLLLRGPVNRLWPQEKTEGDKS